MRIAFIATGDELVAGDTYNTNTHIMANILVTEGHQVTEHVIIPDDKLAIIQHILRLKQNHECIIISGGLGPTSDDITRFALAEALGVALTIKEDALSHVKTRLAAINLSMNEGHRQQAMFPEHAILLPNPNGSAMGCILQQEKTQFVLLPGPPKECLPMFQSAVLPNIPADNSDTTVKLNWMVFAIAEGEIAHKLEQILQDIPCKTGYRLQRPYIEIKVFCDKKYVHEISNRVEPILNPHIICKPNLIASKKFATYIQAHHLQLNFIDNATKGRLAATLITPQTAAYLTEIHENESENMSSPVFKIEGLDEYWSGQAKGQTQIKLGLFDGNQWIEREKLFPFYSEWIIPTVIEWLSFTLLELINESHQIKT